MYRILLLPFLFGFNLAAGDEKAVEPRTEAMTDDPVKVKASHFPGFMCQEHIAAIESMVDAAIEREELGWALMAYAHLHLQLRREEPGIPIYWLGNGVMAGVCIETFIYGGTSVVPYYFGLGCLCLLAATFDQTLQIKNIKEKLLPYLQKALPADRVDIILKDLSDRRAYVNIKNILIKYPELNLYIHDIDRYNKSIEKIYEKQGYRCCYK